MSVGQRANLVLGNRSGYELFYSHRRANTLDADLFWGPDRALEFIRRHGAVTEGADWLDEIWAEGGVVLDLDARHVLFFGGEDVLFDVPLRRVHLSLMRALWPGWTVQWAHGHIAELASYVGRDGEDLLDMDVDPSWVPELKEPAERGWISSLISVRRADGTWKLHALDVDIADVALLGPRWLPRLFAASLPAEYDYAARSSSFPTGGLHINEARRGVEVWLAHPKGAFERRLRAAWAGWDVSWHYDRFEAITDQIGSRLTLPFSTEEALVEQVSSIVLRAPPDRSELDVDGPSTARDDPSAPRLDVWKAQFAHAVDLWRGRASMR